MKKLYISIAVAFIAGVASGAAATWNYARKKAEADFNNRLESVKAKYRDAFIEKVTGKVVEEVTKVEEKNDEEVKNQERTIYDSIADNYSGSIDYTAYSSATDSIDEFPEEDEEEIDIPKNDPSRPRVISDEEYYDEPDMTKLEICLFENGDNSVLTDDQYDPLEEPYKVITKDDLNAFLAQDDVDEIFTVCDARNCMYAIEKQGQSWDEFLKHNPVILDTRY